MIKLSLHHPKLKGFHVTICFILVLFHCAFCFIVSIGNKKKVSSAGNWCMYLHKFRNPICTGFCYLVGNNDVRTCIDLLISHTYVWPCNNLSSRHNNNRGGSRTVVTSKMEHFVIIVNGWKPLTIITKRSIFDAAVVLDPPLKSVYYSNYPMTLYFQVQALKLKCSGNTKSTTKRALKIKRKKKL